MPAFYRIDDIVESFARASGATRNLPFCCGKTSRMVRSGELGPN